MVPSDGSIVDRCKCRKCFRKLSSYMLRGGLCQGCRGGPKPSIGRSVLKYLTFGGLK